MMPIMARSDDVDDDPLRRLEQYLAADTIRVEEARDRLVDIGDALMTLRARMHNIDIGDDPGVQVLTQEMAAPMIDRVAGHVDRTDNVILTTDTNDVITRWSAGAQAILGMSNDSWFTAHPLGARLHLTVAAFRSIETRLPQVRVTTNGLSAVIDDTGTVQARTAMGDQAVLTAFVHAQAPPPTLMVRSG